MQHASAINARCEFFVGREDLLSTLDSWCHQTSKYLLGVVHGGPGTGKSSLVAQFCRRLERKYERSLQKVLVLTHVVGATPASQSLRATLRRFCSELLLHMELQDQAVPEHIDELMALFGMLLDRARNHIFIIIDAVNQVWFCLMLLLKITMKLGAQNVR